MSIFRTITACASTLLLGAALTPNVSADPVILADITAFSGNESLIDFEAIGTQGTPVAAVGDVSFALSPSGIAPRLSLNDTANRPFGPQGDGAIDAAGAGAPFNPYDDLLITFAEPVNRLGFVISANTGTVLNITVSCVVAGVVVDTFEFPDTTAAGFNFIAFQTEETFDEILIDVGNAIGFGFWRLDNLRYEFAPSNLAPISDAGPDQAIRAGDLVQLDGTGSFDDNTASVSLDYAWSLAAVPAGSSATLSGAATATPSFVADVSGSYFVNLVVTDEGSLSSVPDQVMVSSSNLAPMSAAGGDQLVVVGTTVNLDGSDSSDPEVDPLTYAWSLTFAPAGSGAAIANATQVGASFTPDVEGTYEVSLEVSDFIGPGAPDVVQITAASAADYSVQQVVSAGTEVSELQPNQVTNRGNQRALQVALRLTVVAIQTDHPALAVFGLERALSRTDGCVLRGSPDGNGPGRDWITDCNAQIEVYGLLSAALDALNP